MKFIIKTMFGLEPILAKEIENLGAKVLQIGNRMVVCEGNKRFLYTALFSLRTALRILYPLTSFKAKNENELYLGALKVKWDNYLTTKQTFAIDTVANSEIFRHSQFAGLKTKDAIADYFRKKFNVRPNVNTKFPNVKIHLHINRDEINLYLDASGFSLNQRGYRAYSVDAPVNEVLAAGIILIADYKGNRPFIDPMCGSGTFVIEAGLIATNTPPNIRNEYFCVKHWSNFDKSLWNEVRMNLLNGIKKNKFPIWAGDKDFKSFKATSNNITSAHLDGIIQVEKKKFEHFTPIGANSLIIFNPPYDERLKIEDTISFYKNLGDILKKQASNCDAWLISGNQEALKNIGLKTSKKTTLYNGPIECKLHKYELYKGTKN